MKNENKNKDKTLGKKIRTAFFCWALLPVCALTLIASSVAWFSKPKVETKFNASIVKSYFDADSVIKSNSDGTPNLKDSIFIITKPVHFYNLAYLIDNGIFTEKTTFQLGKPWTRERALTSSSDSLGVSSDSSDSSDPTTAAYYVYQNNTDNEESDVNLTKKQIDMSLYTSYGGIPPIGVSTADPSTEFSHAFMGNGITIANCSVTDHAVLKGKTTYFPHVGLFGTIADGTDVSSFNVLNLTVNVSAQNPGAASSDSSADSSADSSVDSSQTSVDMGLMVGYINQSAAKTVTFEKLGVANGVLSAEATAYSAYSLVGNGTPEGLNTAAGYFDVEIASGNTGVVNFTEILNTIRDPNVADGAAKWKYRTTADYNADGTPKSEDENDWSGTIPNGTDDTLRLGYRRVSNYYADNLFDSYLLKDNDKKPVIYGNNCDRGVCFKGNQVIEGTKENGLGVFTIVTRKEDNEGDNWVNGLGDFILRAITPNNDKNSWFTNFYYTTAEYRDPTALKYATSGTIHDTWLPSLTSTPLSYSEADLEKTCYFYEATFDGGNPDGGTGRYFTRDYFGNANKAAGSENYAAYKYLQDYLADTLVYSGGAPIAPDQEEFGITAKYEALTGEDKGTIKNVSTMKYFFLMNNYQGGNSISRINDYAANSIYFTLKEEANITLYVSNRNTYSNNAYVGIYDDEVIKSNEGKYKNSPVKSPSYAIYLPGSKRAFTYYAEDGTKAEKTAGNYLFAHTFKLPAGPYFMTVPNTTLAVCAIEVQGQQDGNAGNIGSKGFSIDFIGSDETGTETKPGVLVGSEGYVWSQTAFVIQQSTQAWIVLTVRFERIKSISADGIATDTVYARVAAGGDKTYIKPVGASGSVEGE